MRPTSLPRGFSLVELLVALAVVAVLLVSVVWAVKQPASRALANELARFEQILQAGSDRAASLGREHRLVLTDSGYQLEERLLGEWKRIEVSPLHPRDWPSGWRAKAAPQQVLISPQGLVSPVQLLLSAGSQTQSMAWDAMGRRLSEVTQ